MTVVLYEERKISFVKHFFKGGNWELYFVSKGCGFGCTCSICFGDVCTKPLLKANPAGERYASIAYRFFTRKGRIVLCLAKVSFDAHPYSMTDHTCMRTSSGMRL